MNQIWQFWYVFKAGDFRIQNIVKTLKKIEMMRFYNGIQLVYVNIDRILNYDIIITYVFHGYYNSGLAKEKAR